MNRTEPLPAPERFAIEKSELEAVLEAGIFAASSNAAKLLRFVCEKYFENAVQVTEYDVAVHALGRRTDFDGRRDSIVRVEAHRVRQQLQEYYKSEGAHHPVRIVLPRGKYIPQFVQATSVDEAAPAESEPRGRSGARRTIWRARSKYAWAVAIILIAGVTARWSALQSSQTLQTGPKLDESTGRADAGGVHILAGLDSGAYVDRGGTRWQADAYFTGGEARDVSYRSLALTDDPAIYEHARVGHTFSYDIPLLPGTYEMRLMFAESSQQVILGTLGEGSRSFRVTANGVQILPPPDDLHMRAFDIIADAGGTDTANVKVFKDITPAPDGKLHLRFMGRSQRALLNAIEIIPGLKGKMRTLRWCANETSYTDRAGNLWLPDRYFRGGRLSRFETAVSGTPDPGLYAGERFGAFAYHIPVAAGSTYRITIHFAENYIGRLAPMGPRPRQFNVYANHLPLLHRFDVSLESGGTGRAVTKTFRGIKPSTFDKIMLSFEPSTEFAIVDAVQVEDEK